MASRAKVDGPQSKLPQLGTEDDVVGDHERLQAASDLDDPGVALGFGLGDWILPCQSDGDLGVLVPRPPQLPYDAARYMDLAAAQEALQLKIEVDAELEGHEQRVGV